MQIKFMYVILELLSFLSAEKIFVLESYINVEKAYNYTSKETIQNIPLCVDYFLIVKIKDFHVLSGFKFKDKLNF